MAGLGIAAGAFEGDSQRTAERQRDEQLAIQRQQIAAQQSQASDRNRLAYAQMASSERGQRAAIDAQQKAQQRQQAFSGEVEAARLQENGRQFDAAQAAAAKRDDFTRKTTLAGMERQNTFDEWALAGKELELRQNQALLQKYTAANAAEAEKMANRKKMAQSNMGAFLQSMVMNGGVASPESLSILNQGLGLSGASAFARAYGTTDAGFVLQTQDGRMEPVDMQMYQAAVKTLLGDEYDTGGKPHQSTTQAQYAQYAQGKQAAQAAQGYKLDPVSASQLKIAEMRVQKWTDALARFDHDKSVDGSREYLEKQLDKAYSEYGKLVGMDYSTGDETGGEKATSVIGGEMPGMQKQNGAQQQQQPANLEDRIRNIGRAVYQRDKQLSFEMERFLNEKIKEGLGEQETYDAFIKKFQSNLSGLGKVSNRR